MRERICVIVRVCELVAFADAVAVPVFYFDELRVCVGERVVVVVSVAICVWVRELVRVVVRVCELVAVAFAFAVPFVNVVGVPLGELERVCDGVRVCVAQLYGVAVCEPVAFCVVVRVRERFGLAVCDGMRERICVCVRVRELVAFVDGDGVPVVDAVAELLFEREPVGERMHERERVSVL